MLILQNEISSAYLDGLVRLRMLIWGRSWTLFQLCGYTGLALASALVLILSLDLKLSFPIMMAVIIVAVFTFLSLAMVTKILKRKESIVYYHHQIAVLAATAILLWFWRQPLLPYLDITILGLGIFLVFGRMGCFMVGCCHGRPFRRGVSYSEDHAVEGFTPYYVGVSLFPIQLLESAWVLGIVCVGVFFVLDINSPGSLLAWYVVTYGFGRFFFEFLRGDTGRRYVWGYSEPQWTSVVLMCVVVWAEWSGLLPFHAWHSIVCAGLLLAMIGILARRSFQNRTARQLLSPRHVQEVAEALDAISVATSGKPSAPGWPLSIYPSHSANEILISRTSLGVQLSGNRIKNAGERIYHFALSHNDGGMTEKTAQRLARLIVALRPAEGSSEFVAGRKGVFHLFIHSRS